MNDEITSGNEREDRPEWVVLRETLDPVEAELIAGLLRSGGIDAHVESRVFRQEPLPAIRAMSRILIWVPSDDREHAEEVLTTPNTPLEDDVDPDPDPA